MLCLCSTGIWVSVDFFEDILVPEYSLQQPSTYDSHEKQWIWDCEGDKVDLSAGDTARLRVTDVIFHEIETPAQLKLKGDDLDSFLKPPLSIIWYCIADKDGLMGSRKFSR